MSKSKSTTEKSAPERMNRSEGIIPSRGKKTKTFKEYYDTDPEFRKKHLEYLKVKVICSCGHETSRSNLSKHKSSHLHTNRLESNETIKKKELIKAQKELAHLMEVINKLLE